MTNLKKLLAAGTAALTITAVTVTSFATVDYKTPAEVVAGLVGKTAETVIAEKNESGKTYGAIASEAGKLDAFKAASLEMKKDNLAAQVAAGTITQEKADEIIAAIEEAQANCDGTGGTKIGRTMGAKFGSNGTGAGNGQGGMGKGQGNGGGRRMGAGGMGLQDGSCYVTPAN